MPVISHEQEYIGEMPVGTNLAWLRGYKMAAEGIRLLDRSVEASWRAALAYMNG